MPKFEIDFATPKKEREYGRSKLVMCLVEDAREKVSMYSKHMGMEGVGMTVVMAEDGLRRGVFYWSAGTARGYRAVGVQEKGEGIVDLPV